MQNDAPLKAIASAAILVLVIGFVSKIVTIKQPLLTNNVTSPIESVQSSPRNIDPSFFNYNEPQAPISTIASQSSASSPSAFSPRAKAIIPTDIITADSYLVGNLATGEIYLEKDPSAIRPIASISKLFSAAIAVKNMNEDAMVVVASSSITGYDATNSPSTIAPGESFSMHDILYDMILVSSNDAATTIADNYASATGGASQNSRADFVALMNNEVASLGMISTSFKDPSGLSPGNDSSANDLFKFAQYLYKDRPDILAITKTPEYDVATTTEHNAHKFINIDPFVYDTHYLGGKTGRTDAAGETMLSMFNIVQGVNSYPIAIIVLHSSQDARQIDSSVLLGRVIRVISEL